MSCSHELSYSKEDSMQSYPVISCCLISEVVKATAIGREFFFVLSMLSPSDAKQTKVGRYLASSSAECYAQPYSCLGYLIGG